MAAGRASASTTAGRSSRSRSGSGSSRTTSPLDGRRGRTSACSSAIGSTTGSCYKLRHAQRRALVHGVPAALAGVTFVDEAMAIPAVRTFLEALLHRRGRAHHSSRSPDIRREDYVDLRAGALRQHRGARPDRPAVHRRQREVPDVPDPDDRAPARRRRAGRPRGDGAGRLGALPGHRRSGGAGVRRRAGDVARRTPPRPSHDPAAVPRAQRRDVPARGARRPRASAPRSRTS